ncbi:phosphate regulon sensor histidine kinase PhoR [Lutibaculum baratangense]|uniref:histidine kinase n=1 Tax=Lutibaculum baratangense AMV1 TaxID=631454 RepID=V4TP05_9HYPH|nr:phosphate regulon sensor histidine kinase PhoR [Lutibaculum baratangense]ESR27408.1 Phosphate regulon sensor protein PhoR (SphS) [Lutibaculum baratangense AMV1]
MTLPSESSGSREARPTGSPRLRLAVALGAMAGLFLLLMLSGALHPWIAVLSFLTAAAVVSAAWPVLGGHIPATAPTPNVIAGTDRSDLLAFAEALPDPCLLVDRYMRVRHQNGAAAELLGKVESTQPLNFVLRAPEVSEAVLEVVKGRGPRVVTYFEKVPVDRWFEATVRRVTREQGPQELFLVLLRDLTEAQRVERMRADFVANASHELRTPLASLIGFIETLQGPARNDAKARERFLEVMAVQARRMSRLIDDLMSLSRIELKAHMRPGTVVDLAPIVEHVAEAMQPLAAGQGVEIRVEVRERPVQVVGDRDELAQVFQNLIHNAVKYGHSGGSVEIELRRQARGGTRPEAAVVTVRDHGPGIPPEHIPRLTERFYRVDVASSRDKGGTGLGLAIVKHIMTRHRGQLTIESEVGKGAAFSVFLDVAGGRGKDVAAATPMAAE